MRFPAVTWTLSKSLTCGFGAGSSTDVCRRLKPRPFQTRTNYMMKRLLPRSVLQAPASNPKHVFGFTNKSATARDARKLCAHEMFEAQAARTPNAIAIVCGNVELRYRELNERANQLAHELVRLGVVSDSLVGICLDRSPEMIVAVLATLKAGGAYVPLDPTYPEERLAFMLEDAKVSVLLTQSRFVTTLSSSDD